MPAWEKYQRRRAQVNWDPNGLMPDVDHHTKTKHLLLESYLQDWVETLTGNCRFGTDRVTLVDGFCGGGIYKDGESSWSGSPIRMIQAVEEGWKSVKERKPYQELDIAYLFVDAQKEHTDCLKQEIREAGFGAVLDSGRCRVVTAFFEDELESCLGWVKERGGYSFFFLDPYGMIDASGMSKAILSLGRSEVLVNFMQSDSLMRPVGTSIKNQKLPDFLERHHFSEHYDWLNQIGEYDTLQKQTLLHDSALRFFRERSGAKFVWTFAFMRNPKTVYYYLVHMSNSSTAVSVMRHTLWQYNNLDYQFHYGIYGLGYRTVDALEQNLAFLDIHQRNKDSSQENLKDGLDRFIFEQESIPFRELFEGTVEQHPATREDYMNAIHQMVLDGDLEIIRDDKSRCTSSLYNRDIIRPAGAKQLIMLPGQVSQRIPPKRQVSRRSASKSKNPPVKGQGTLDLSF